MTCWEQRHYIQKQFSHFTVNQNNKYYFLHKTVTFFIRFAMATYLFVCCMDVFSQLLKELNSTFTLSVLQDSFWVNKSSLTLFLNEKWKGLGLKEDTKGQEACCYTPTSISKHYWGSAGVYLLYTLISQTPSRNMGEAPWLEIN